MKTKQKSDSGKLSLSERLESWATGNGERRAQLAYARSLIGNPVGDRQEARRDECGRTWFPTASIVERVLPGKEILFVALRNGQKLPLQRVVLVRLNVFVPDKPGQLRPVDWPPFLSDE